MDLITYLDIKTNLVTAKKVILSLKISAHHKQPLGLVHGGLNGILIETACSLGAKAALPHHQVPIGVNLEVTHLKAAYTGTLKVIALPEKVGKSMQVWQANVWNDTQKTATGQCILVNKFIK